MFAGFPDGPQRAITIAEKLASHSENLSHGRTIGIRKALEWGLNIKDLSEMPELMQQIWKLYCLIELYFDRTPAVKIFENSRGTSWSRAFHEQVVQIPNTSSRVSTSNAIHATKDPAAISYYPVFRINSPWLLG